MPLISLCMIVKNEEANLFTCLNGIAKYMDEVIIIDTGSIDNTKEIALKFTDKVYDFCWVNDFAAARNYAISKTSNEYILFIDSDEFVETIDIDEMKRMIELNPDKIGRLHRINKFTRKGITNNYCERVNRLFSKRFYQYEGIIHEQVVPMNGIEIGSYYIPLSMRHFGYEGDLSDRKKKTDRNISLLKCALQDKKEDPYLIYQLGKSYYMEEEFLKACDYFEQALYFDLNPKLEYVQDMVESYGYSLLNSEQYEKANSILNVYEEFSHSADYIFLAALIFMNVGKFSLAIEEFIKASMKIECKMEGVNDYLAFYNIGVIYECLGDVHKAMEYYKKCKNYEPALMRLKEKE